jgi:hypothetical protein
MCIPVDESATRRFLFGVVKAPGGRRRESGAFGAEP